MVNFLVALFSDSLLGAAFLKYKKLNTILNAVKSVKRVSFSNNHKHAHLLRDSVFNLYALKSEITSMIKSKITSMDDISIGEKEIKEYIFNEIEGITCNYGCHIATSLKQSVDATICCLGYPPQKTRVLIKTIDDDTEINFDGTRKLSDNGGIIGNAIWDEESWIEVKPKIINKKGIPKHRLNESTALSQIVREKCVFFSINDTRIEKYYDPAPDIYEKGFYSKLVLPIRYTSDDGNNIFLFGFVVVLIENNEGFEIFKDDPNSLMVSLGLSVADLLAILMSQIHFFNSSLDNQLMERIDSITQKRRASDE